MFFKISALKKFRKFHSKTPVLESVFDEIAGLKACNFAKKKLQHRRYLVKFAKFLKTLFFTEHLFTVTACVCSENKDFLKK